MANVVQLNSMV